MSLYSPSLPLNSYKATAHPVDITSLTNVLKVDLERMVVTVEGALPMGLLTKETLKHGVLPRVVPEFPTFSVSGLGACVHV